MHYLSILMANLPLVKANGHSKKCSGRCFFPHPLVINWVPSALDWKDEALSPWTLCSIRGS